MQLRIMQFMQFMVRQILGASECRGKGGESCKKGTLVDPCSLLVQVSLKISPNVCQDMKLDASVIRYLSPEDRRILLALESCMLSTGSAYKSKQKIHSDATLNVICDASGMRPGGCRKILMDLARRKLVSVEHNNKKGSGEDSAGYRLTYAGFDALALQELAERNSVTGVGRKLGVGKESDIYLAACPEHGEIALKFHRLGRTSFRSVKINRDYHEKQQQAGKVCWLWLSKEAAGREYAFMKALYETGLPVPRPVDHSRHVIGMEYIGGACNDDSVETARLLANVRKDDIKYWAPAGFEDTIHELYEELMASILTLAQHGLIHGDFNEFNLMLRLPLHEYTRKFVMIDFPQMVSTSHPEARFYFERDIKCVATFFARRFGYGRTVTETGSSAEEEEEEEVEYDKDVTLPSWEDVLKLSKLSNLDKDLRASGWKGVVNGVRSKDAQLDELTDGTGTPSDEDNSSESTSEYSNSEQSQ